MRFNPVPPEQMDSPSYELLPNGTYKFVVDQATEKKSKSGNEMIELILEHTDADGRTHKIWDYLVATEAAAWKTYQFCKAAGLTAEYDEGALGEADCQGKIVLAKVKIQKSEQYGDKLKVESYEPAESSSGSDRSSTESALAGKQPAPAGPHGGIDEEDIPF